MDNSTIQIWAQMGITLIAAISYIILYRQQKSLADNYSALITKYKEGYDSMNTQLEFYKKLINMEGMQSLVDHNVAIKTPEIEQRLINRIYQDGNHIINARAIYELLGEMYEVSSYLYNNIENKTTDYLGYLQAAYPDSSDILIWYIGQVSQPLPNQEQA